MTKKQAIELFESGFWETMTFEDRAKFQLFETKLCMPFDVFQEALEKTLERPVFTHELGLNVDGLKKELLGEDPCPSLTDILDLIPEEKRIVVRVG